MLTAGALPYSRKHILRASSLASRATSRGDIFVCIYPTQLGSGFGSCKATCCPAFNENLSVKPHLLK